MHRNKEHLLLSKNTLAYSATVNMSAQNVQFMAPVGYNRRRGATKHPRYKKKKPEVAYKFFNLRTTKDLARAIDGKNKKHN